MSYIEINLRSDTPLSVSTEVMYEIASARVGGKSLVRFNLMLSGEEKNAKRLLSSLKRTLKNMKGQGTIQFYALPDNFTEMRTEANFLINKFPSLFEQMPKESEDVFFAYAKI